MIPTTAKAPTATMNAMKATESPKTGGATVPVVIPEKVEANKEIIMAMPPITTTMGKIT